MDVVFVLFVIGLMVGVFMCVATLWFLVISLWL